MLDLIFITNRALCRENFLVRVEKLAALHPVGIVLREKDLPEQDYRRLAQAVLEICGKETCILHNFVGTAADLGCPRVHVPMPVLEQMTEEQKRRFREIGVSCHSAEQVRQAQKLGCTYVTLGHIFQTRCKPGLPGRGLELLRQVCAEAAVPVYAIGGISGQNIASVRDAGASGACVMSGAMECDDVEAYVKPLEKRGETL